MGVKSDSDGSAGGLATTLIIGVLGLGLIALILGLVLNAIDEWSADADKSARREKKAKTAADSKTKEQKKSKGGKK